MVSAQSSQKKWNFDGDADGKPPAGFAFARTGQGSDGQWVVKKDESARSKPNVLAQTSQDKTDYRFPLAIAEGTSYLAVLHGITRYSQSRAIVLFGVYTVVAFLIWPLLLMSLLGLLDAALDLRGRVAATRGPPLA